MRKSPEQLAKTYRLTLERALVSALLLLLIFFHSLPKRFLSPAAELPAVTFRFTVEEMPATRQAVRPQVKPQHPAVPVAAEVPDMLHIADAGLESSTGESAGAGILPTTAVRDTVPPRPMVQVLPEYTRELQKLNVRGIVRLNLWVNERGVVEHVVVSENSTGNAVCEQAAIEAAKKSSYWPATIDKMPVGMWVPCTYTFKPN